MSDIVKNESSSAELETSRMREWQRWDPFRAMRDWLRWDPFRAAAPALAISGEWSPSFEVRENPDSFLFKADLPGLAARDVEVSMLGNRLQITGKREAEKETKDDTIYLFERSFGSFLRSFTLPDEIDPEHVRSEMKDGVLTVVVPKKPAARARKITISTGTSKS